MIDWNQAVIPFGPPLVDRVKPQDIKTLAQGLGLKLAKEFDAGKYHFGLIFLK